MSFSNMPTSSIQSLPINPKHVAQQFSRRKKLEGARFILDEIATRMLERLQYIRLEPNTLIDMGCGPGYRVKALQARYPNVHYIGVDSCHDYIDEANNSLGSKGFNALINKIIAKKQPSFLLKDMADTGLAPESAELVWSNLALHWHPCPEYVIKEWRRLLTVGGLCMFSCFGPHTLIELREAMIRADLKTQMMSFVDMHDFGDIMLENGFLDPVMDQEMITLTYKTPEKLLADVYSLGGNPSVQRSNGLKGRGWYEKLLNSLEQGRKADGMLHLTLEVAYGHAWKSGTIKGNIPGETRVSIHSIGRI